jgi:hypothetical protein
MSDVIRHVLEVMQRMYAILLNTNVNNHMIVTGSISELHIVPMLSCIRDIDLMILQMKSLAIPSRREIPRHLPPMGREVNIYSTLRIYIIRIVDIHNDNFELLISTIDTISYSTSIE